MREPLEISLKGLTHPLANREILRSDGEGLSEMRTLRQRHRQPEVMDQPGLDPEQHERALAGLARINSLSRTARTYLRPLADLQRRLGVPRLRILDLASGGGDVAIRLWELAADVGLDWRVSGCDLSPVAVEHARRESQRKDVPVHFFRHDAVNGTLPPQTDAVICSLFLHHLDEPQTVALLSKAAVPGGPNLLLINDLDRRLVGLLLAHVVPRLLTTSPVVHTDAVLSVKAAYTPEEILALAKQAGLAGATVRRCWPWRWLLEWRRP